MFEGDKKDKKLLFMLKDENVMIHAIYNVEEDEEMLEFLIDKIKSNSSDKLLFVYEYIKQEGF